MKVTADQVAALRAVLTGDLDTHERVYERLDPTMRQGYLALVTAAFFRAAEQKFKDGNRSEVVEFVEKARARSDRLAESIDPQVAEHLLMAVSTGDDIDDVAPEIRGRHFILLLTGLIVDASLTGQALDDFLGDARELADEWLTGDN
ncbi:hypothetical protein [Actinoallomurus sp. CA-150999]|uniref:hypothetical protein n=1 Tax=Actinoallomurus sp. CA-150999 TaxID=3239887 RepID=UPI003D925BF6